jgi:hypothetical protein
MPLIFALPNITIIPLADPAFPNIHCWDYPNQEAGRPFYFTPSSTTNTTLNTFHSNSFNSIIVIDAATNDTFAWYHCDDRTGILSEWGTASPIFFTDVFTDEQEDGGRELKYMTNGTTPENYALEVEDVRVEGTYLGLANQTI